MPNPSLLAMEEEAAVRELLSLTQVEVEALEWRLGQLSRVLNNPEGLDPENHARYAAEARALWKVLSGGS